MSSMLRRFYTQSARLNELLNTDPNEAVKQARLIDSDTPERLNLLALQAATLVDGGALTQQLDAIEEGVTLFRELYDQAPTSDILYNLANGLVAASSTPPREANWLDHQEHTREHRAEARQYFWQVARDVDVDSSLRTQAWTNLANQFNNSFRLGEAHDGWLSALEIDPENGVAASSASRNLLWFYRQGVCSDQTYIEAAMLAKIAHRHRGRVIRYAGTQAAEQIATFAAEFDDPPPRTTHADPFIRWVECERLTLAPVVELVDPALGSVRPETAVLGRYLLL